jgi:HSP20 family molecular chaperone IbpA
MYGKSNIDKIFDSFFNGEPMYRLSTNMVEGNKPYEINYTKDGAYLLYEVPGFNKNNLKVEMEDGYLYIEGKRTYKLNGEEMSKTVSNKFKLNSDYNASSIEATVEDGILTVFIPNYKKTEKKRISLL